jgi:hypothetical protein
MEMNVDTIEVNGVKYVRADQAVSIAKERKGAWVIGEKYIIRTVTMIQTGRLVYIDEHELVLEDAAWIADTDRFSTALRTGVLKEVEPFPGEAGVGRGSIVDFCVWSHNLPRSQK